MLATALEPSQFTPTCQAHRIWNAVPVPAEALIRFGWRRLVWTRWIYRNQFRQLLDELCGDDCVHTWAQILLESPVADDPVVAVLAHEAENRPTEFVSYLGMRADGSLELVAVGSVAERISHAFPFDGFPVIARCYMRRRFRGAGLYRSLLAQRVALCREIWGQQLKAIHLGTANPRVMSSATSTIAGGAGARFVQVGEEDLGSGARQHRVAALFSFTQSFSCSVREAVDGWIGKCGPGTGRADWAMVLRRHFHDLVASGLKTRDYAALLEIIESLETRTGRDLVGECRPVQELFTMFDAIPLIREQSSP
jgi:hypothetical protein